MRSHRLLRRLLTSALLVPAAAPAPAQAPARRHVVVPTVAPRPADVATVDGVVKAYYDVITGPAGQPREWSRDRSLYIPTSASSRPAWRKAGPTRA